jgi:hypothetical protein
VKTALEQDSNPFQRSRPERAGLLTLWLLGLSLPPHPTPHTPHPAPTGLGEWTCPTCQTHHDRDENAARNLRLEGIRILSTDTVGHTEIQACGEAVRLVGTCAKKRVSEKQESPATLRSRSLPKESN